MMTRCSWIEMKEFITTTMGLRYLKSYKRNRYGGNSSPGEAVIQLKNLTIQRGKETLLLKDDSSVTS